MIKKYKNNSVTWIDVEDPTAEEVRTLMNEYDINPDIARELQLPTYKEKVVVSKDYLYLVLHFPTLRHTHKDNTTEQEVDFIVGKDFIITTRYEQIDPIERFLKTFELNKILNKGLMEDDAGYVLYYMIKELYKAMSDEVDSINDTLKEIEKNIFKGKEKEMVLEISKINKDLINFNHVILTHQVIDSLINSGGKIFGKGFSDNFTKILNDYHRIEKALSNNIDFLHGLRSTNDSLLSSKQNETMKTLTVIAFLALPFTIITGFFQMNAVHTPFVGMDNDWYAIVIVEIIFVIIAFLFVKWRKWI